MNLLHLHEIAATSGDGLHPDLLRLFEFGKPASPPIRGSSPWPTMRPASRCRPALPRRGGAAYLSPEMCCGSCRRAKPRQNPSATSTKPDQKTEEETA